MLSAYGPTIILDDIIIADAIHDYASGKIKEQPSGDIEFLKEMNQIPASRKLIALVSEFISNPEHIRKINDAIHDANLKEEKENLSAHIAKTVCGPFVVASSTFIEDLQRDERKLQALDMEGFALYATAHTLDKKALWIKSVSDFADIKNPMDIIRHVVLQVVFFYMNLLEKCYKYIVPFVE